MVVKMIVAKTKINDIVKNKEEPNQVDKSRKYYHIYTVQV